MNTDGYGEFMTACAELKNCKFIIAESKIALLLKAIADNRQLYSMFGAALYDFDYKTVFAECVKSGSGFVPPSDPKTAIALVFRILVDIDSGKMSLRNFLEAYFYSESVNESYARFGLEVIAPFEPYCRMFITKAETHDELLSESGDIARNYDDFNDKYYADLKNDALGCVAALTEFADNGITGVIDRAEYTACLNGLIRVIKADASDSIVSAFLGVKYAVAYFFKSDPKVNEIYKKLEYDIKHLSGRNA